ATASIAVPAAQPSLRSFPTRRSSDLRTQAAAFLRKSVERGRLEAGQDEAIMANWVGTTEKADLAQCDLVIEAVFEDLKVKHELLDRKSTRLNSSHVKISYAVFCLKKK